MADRRELSTEEFNYYFDTWLQGLRKQFPNFLLNEDDIQTHREVLRVLQQSEKEPDLLTSNYIHKIKNKYNETYLKVQACEIENARLQQELHQLKMNRIYGDFTQV
jgi:hypothetical protein